MAAEYPNINGLEYSYSSIVLNVDGQQYLGVTSINYNDKLSPAYSRGTSPVPLGGTAGEWEGGGDIEFNKTDAQALIDALGDGWGRRTIQITIQYADDGMDVITDDLPAVRLISADSSNSAGSDPSKTKFGLWLLKPIKRNGIAITPDIDTRATTSQ